MAVVVNVVEMLTGTFVRTLPLASVPAITETLNQPDTCQIRIPRQAYTETETPVLVDPAAPSEVFEYQVVVDSVVEFRGPAVNETTSSSDGWVTLECHDPLWYLAQRILDGVGDERLVDADFDAPDLDDWDVDAAVTSATKDADIRRTGDRSLKLVNSGAGEDAAVRQVFTETSGVIGLFLTFSAWLHIDTLTAPAYESRGLHVAGYLSAVLQENDWHPLDLATLDHPELLKPNSDGWVQLRAFLRMPPSVTWQIEVSYMAPQGTVYWDTGKNRPEASISTAGLTGSVTEEVDAADWIGLLVAHAQDPTWGKSDLAIGTDLPATGIMLAKTIMWTARVQFDEAVREITDQPDGPDYEVNRANRAFTLYPGGQGADLTATVTLFYSADPADVATKNIASYTSTRIIPKTRSKFLGDGDGVTRDVGEYADASQLGGLILEEVQAAPQRATPWSLEPLARAAVSSQPRPFRQIVAVLKDLGAGLPTCRKGDHVTVVINDGRTQVNAPFRCVTRTLQPYSNSAVVTLNEEIV